MPAQSVMMEFSSDQGYTITDDTIGDLVWRQYLLIEWRGSSTLYVYDSKDRVRETTVFTNYEANTPEQAVTIMYDWAKAHEYERKVSR